MPPSRPAEGSILLWYAELSGSRESRASVRSRLMQHALSSHLGVDPGSVEIDRRCVRCGHPSHGKPRVLARPDLQFNASATEGLAVIAVTWDMPIGVDVEPEARVVEPEVLAVAEALEETPSRPRERLSAWLRHEAGVKALGAGLVGELDDHDLAWLRACSFSEIPLPNRTIACVASPRRLPIEVRRAPS